MKAYILTVIASTLLCAFCVNLAPDKWQKYIKIITGLVLIICILSPIKSFIKTDWIDALDIENADAIEGKTQDELIKDDLTERIENDIEERLKNEFNISVSARVTIDAGNNGEIKGVKEIRVSGGKLTEDAKARLCEVYGVPEVYNE